MSQGTKIVAVVLFVLFLGTGIYYLTVSPTPQEPVLPVIEAPRPVAAAPAVPPEPMPITNNPVSARGGETVGARASDPLAGPSRIARTATGAPAVVMPPLAVPRGGNLPTAAGSAPDAAATAPAPSSIVMNPPTPVRPAGSTPSAAAPLPNPAGGPARTAAREHVVAAGETLSSIAARHLGAASRWREIARANPAVNPDNLRVGTKLVLPEPGAVPARASASLSSSPAPVAAGSDPATYVVRSGDTLAAIARRTLGTADWATLYAANRELIGPDPAALRVGMKLSIPKRS